MELLLRKKGRRDVSGTPVNASVSASASRASASSTQFSLQRDVLFHILDPSADTSTTTDGSHAVVPER